MGSESRTAVVAGANGLVGSALLQRLLEAEDYGRVYALSRRPLAFEHARLANRILPMEQVEAKLTGLQFHDAYCCLGSTRRKAGSEEDRRRVDVDLVLAFARAVRACGAQRFIVISSVGASATAKQPYLRDKAEMEAGLAALGFPSLDVLRPSLLLGSRAELRPGELAARLVLPLFKPLMVGSLRPYRAIRARDVAAAMLGAARSQRRGVYVYAGEALETLARAGRRPVRSAA